MKANATQLIKVLVAELQEHKSTVEKQIKYTNDLKAFISKEIQKEIKVDTRQLEQQNKLLHNNLETFMANLDKKLKQSGNAMFYSILVFIIGVVFLVGGIYFSVNSDEKLTHENQNLSSQNHYFRQFFKENPKNSEAYNNWVENKTKE